MLLLKLRSLFCRNAFPVAEGDAGGTGASHTFASIPVQANVAQACCWGVSASILYPDHDSKGARGVTTAESAHRER